MDCGRHLSRAIGSQNIKTKWWQTFYRERRKTCYSLCFIVSLFPTDIQSPTTRRPGWAITTGQPYGGRGLFGGGPTWSARGWRCGAPVCVENFLPACFFGFVLSSFCAYLFNASPFNLSNFVVKRGVANDCANPKSNSFRKLKTVEKI